MKKIIIASLIIQFFFSFNNFIYSQWTQTNGPFGGTVLSLLPTFQKIYAGTETAGIFTSTDGGSNWTASNNGLIRFKIQALAITSDSLKIFAGTDSGLYISTNFGSSWTPVNNGITNLNIRSIATVGLNTYAGTLGNGVFKSTNYGTSWTPLSLGISNLSIKTIALNGSTVFVGSSNRGIFKSTNNGTSWIRLNDGITGDTIINEIAINGIYVYSGNGKNIYRSTITGSSWVVFGSGISNLSVTNITFSSDSVYISISYAMYYKNLANATGAWNSFFSGLLQNRTINDLKRVGTNLIAGVYTGGIYIKNTSKFLESNKGLKALAIFTIFNNCNDILVGSQNGLYHSINKGDTWNTLTFNISGFKFAKLNNELYLSGSLYNVFKSNNNGMNWYNSFVDSLSTTIIYSLHTLGNKIYGANFFIYPPRLYISTNFGNSWNLSNSGIPSKGRIWNITSLGSKLFCCMDYPYCVYKSTNFGMSWFNSRSGLTSDIVEIISNGSDLYAASSDSVFKSTNYGSNWIPASAGISTNDIYFMNSKDNMIFCATLDNGVFLSTNNGSSWSKINTGFSSLNFLVSSIEFDDEFVYAGTYTGVWKRPLSDFSPQNNSENENSDYDLLQNYPNPFNPNTIIKYSIQADGFVELKVFDILGKEISVLVNEKQKSGFHEIEFNGGELAAGVYFYKLKTESYTQTKRMLLIK